MHTIQVTIFGNRRYEWMPTDTDRQRMAAPERLQALIQLYTRNYSEDSEGATAPVDVAVLEALERVFEQFADSPAESAGEQAESA